MTTIKQIDANRENARRSTGPRSVSGKARVRYNALKHGLLAEAALLPDEDGAAFRDFSKKVLVGLRPVGEMESILADRVINSLWRLRRFNDVETGLFVREAEADERTSLDETWGRVKHGNSTPPPTAPSGGTSPAVSKALAMLVEIEIEYITRTEEARSANPRQRLGDAFAHDAATGNAFSKLARYETHLNRTLERTLRQLQELQQERQRSLNTT